MGLKWSLIDFKKKTISISHSIVQAKIDGKSVIIGKDQMKNKSSLRTLPLVPFAEELLRREKQRQEERQTLFAMGYDKKYVEYICVDEEGTLIKPAQVSDAFKVVLTKAKLPIIRFHELRHSCASLLIENGFSMKQVQEWLGHSTYFTTADIYSHLDFSNKVSVGNAIGGLFGGNPFSGIDETPKEEILLGGDDIVNDEPTESALDEYDTGNNVILTNKPKIPKNEPIQVAISEQDYADYLKWKNQMSKNTAQI